MPRLAIALANRAEAFEICQRLREGEPPVYVGHGRLTEGRLVIDPLCLDEEGVAILAARLREVL
jgi:hypothetical protein